MANNWSNILFVLKATSENHIFIVYSIQIYIFAKYDSVLND